MGHSLPSGTIVSCGPECESSGEILRFRLTLEPDADSTKRIAQACHRSGVVVLTCGSFANVIRLLPPLVIGAELLEEGLGVLADSIDEVLGGS